MLTETVLLDWQRQVLQELNDWIEQFTTMTEGARLCQLPPYNSSFGRVCSVVMFCLRFQAQDAFVGFQKDTPASVIFQATQQLHEEQGISSEKMGDPEWMEAVLHKSQDLLLHMASPDALIRLQRTILADQQEQLSQTYFSEQCHGSIVEFLSHNLAISDELDRGQLIQVNSCCSLWS